MGPAEEDLTPRRIRRARFFGGPGECKYGCIGLGDCEAACPHGAIQVCEGIAKVEGFTVFVPNSLKGEKVRILIVKVLSSHAFGKIIENN